MENIATPLSPTRQAIQSRLIEMVSVGALAGSLMILSFGAFFAVRDHLAENSCLKNLHRIAAATLMYSDDFDGYFPAAYKSTRWPMWKSSNWSWSLEPYLRAGATSEMGKNTMYRTDGGTKGNVSLGWANAGGATWHCPADTTGSNVSYGSNPFVLGADEYLEEGIRVDSWRPSKRKSEIPEPERVLLAGDTTKQWHEDVGKYYEVYGDWMRDRDLPKKDGHAMSLAEELSWYREFLSEDDTEIRGECPRPGGYGCKGPAYWHFRRGTGDGSAGMVFCDGHVRAMPFGSIHVENLLPEVDLQGTHK